jgi:hypothetical protein
LIKVKISGEQLFEAKRDSKLFKIPTKDALHRILARDNKAILITRDKHFFDLRFEQEIKKPEDLI